MGNDWRFAHAHGRHAREAVAREAGQRPRSDRDRARPRLPHVGSRGDRLMALFGRKPTLAEAVELVRGELRAGNPPPELLEELRKREPLVSGGREPPGLQEMMEAVPGAAALLEVGARIVARNQRMEQLFGPGRSVLEATRS